MGPRGGAGVSAGAGDEVGVGAGAGSGVGVPVGGGGMLIPGGGTGAGVCGGGGALVQETGTSRYAININPIISLFIWDFASCTSVPSIKTQVKLQISTALLLIFDINYNPSTARPYTITKKDFKEKLILALGKFRAGFYYNC